MRARRVYKPLVPLLVSLWVVRCGDDGSGPQTHVLVLSTPPPAAVQNRVPFTTQPIVQIRASDGSSVAQAGVVIAISITAGGGTLNGSTTATTGAQGSATFTDLAITGTVGPRTLIFSAAGLTSATASVTVTPGVATTIAVNAGNNQRAIPTSSVRTAPSVVVTDADANRVSGLAVTFDVASGGGSITGASPTTDASGIATVGSWSLGPTPGPNTLTATAMGLAGSPVVFTASGVGDLKTLSAGGEHSCGLTTDNAAFCWGDHFYAQIGNGTPDSTATNWLTPSPVAGESTYDVMTAGGFHTCALTSNGAAHCWGYNGGGRLGTGSTNNAESPVIVSGALVFQKVFAGSVHTCAITPSATGYCWGRNAEGQVGDGSTTDRLSPVAISGGHAFQSLDNLGRHTCGLLTNNVIYCWGYNAFGQLGDGSTTNRLSPVPVAGGLTFQVIAAGANHSCALTSGGEASCWGANERGQLGDGTTTNRATPVPVSGGLTFSTIDAGIVHTCALTLDGSAYCWGGNNSRQLGDGTTIDRLTPTPVVGNLTFQALSVGGAHNCGMTTAGTPYCWGQNIEGALGDGTTTNRSEPVPVRWP